MRLIKKSLAITGVVALLAPAGAFAQSSSDESYGGSAGVVAGLEQGGGGGGNKPAREQGNLAPSAPVKQQSQGGNLPFTGADLGVLVAAGGLLLGLGFGLRRLTHRPAGA